MHPSDEYMPAEQKQYLDRFRGKLETVLDIGAHVGTFSCQAAVRGARVLAIEPCQDNYSALLGNILINGLESSITPQRIAVYTESGQVLPLRGTSKHRMFGSGQKSLCFKESYDVCCEAQTISLGDAIRKAVVVFRAPIDYLKMDIEGAEFILAKQGPEPLLGKAINYISIDLHTPTNDTFYDTKDTRSVTEHYADIVNWLKDSGVINARIDKHRAIGGAV